MADTVVDIRLALRANVVEFQERLNLEPLFRAECSQMRWKHLEVRDDECWPQQCDHCDQMVESGEPSLVEDRGWGGEGHYKPIRTKCCSSLMCSRCFAGDRFPPTCDRCDVAAVTTNGGSLYCHNPALVSCEGCGGGFFKDDNVNPQCNCDICGKLICGGFLRDDPDDAMACVIHQCEVEGCSNVMCTDCLASDCYDEVETCSTCHSSQLSVTMKLLKYENLSQWHQHPLDALYMEVQRGASVRASVHAGEEMEHVRKYKMYCRKGTCYRPGGWPPVPPRFQSQHRMHELHAGALAIQGQCAQRAKVLLAFVLSIKDSKECWFLQSSAFCSYVVDAYLQTW